MKKEIILPQARFNPITPEYRPLPEKPKNNFQIPQYIFERAQAKKANVSIYFDSLIKSLRTGSQYMGAELDFEYSSSYLGHNDSFKPDSLKLYEKGLEATEIKVAQFRRGEFLCRKRQLQLYYNLLMYRLNQGDELPSINYALIRYGDRNDYELHHCSKDGKKVGNGKHRCNNHCLTQNLSSKIKDVSIVPLNLGLGIFALSRFHRRKMMNQLSSRESRYEEYIHIATRLCSELHGHYRKKPVQSIDELFGDSIDRGLREILMLDSLKIERTRSQKNLKCIPAGMNTSYPIEQFPIVRFEMPEDAEKEWLRNFKKYNGKLLAQCVGEMQQEMEF